MPEASLIIVSHNCREPLRACLRAIAAHAGIGHETIVVDNASDDGTAAMIRAEFPWARLEARADNPGFSAGNNIGLAMATGEWLVLLNPDTELRPGALPAWIAAHRARGAGISGPRLLNPDGTLQPSAWKVPGLRSALLELLGLHRLLGAHHYPAARFASDFEPGFVSGAAMLFHRGWLPRVSGLDEALFWSEDADLCLRIRALGGSCWYLSGPAIVHIGGESARRNPRRAISNQLISRVKLARKHGGPMKAFAVGAVIGLHIATRIAAFGLTSLFRPEPRADAYRYTAGRFVRYALRGDRSV